MSQDRVDDRLYAVIGYQRRERERAEMRYIYIHHCAN